MRDWHHKCSLEWMRARQAYLTASDVRELVPFTESGKPRKIDDNRYLKVYAGKCKTLTEDDCVSSGAAARGHALESRAVYEANRALHEVFFHWDDCLIKNHAGLAFSPDACTIMQPSDVLIRDCSASQDKYGIMEVKCYGAERHFKTVFTAKMELEERWQIATAMAVDSMIDHAYLVLFNPSMISLRLCIKMYSRDDLLWEIDEVNKVVNGWRSWMPPKEKGIVVCKHANDPSEEDLFQGHLCKRNMNP